MIQKKINILDIAKMAGVSTATVSRYLNGKYQYMSGETRRRIEKTIEKLDYTPSSVARSLKLRQSHLVGVITTDIFIPESSKTFSGFSDGLVEEGFIPLFLDSHNDKQVEKHCIEICIDQADAIIMRPIHKNFEIYMRLVDKGLPVVLFDRYFEEWPYDAVYIDQYQSMVNLMQRLFRHGFEEYHILSSTNDKMNTRMIRRKAFTDSLKENGYDSEKSVHTVLPSSNEIFPGIEDILLEITGSNKHKRRVLVLDSNVLLGPVMTAAKNRHISIPHDLALCSYCSMNQTWPTALTPSVTTVDLPSYKMAYLAAKLAVKRIMENNNPNGTDHTGTGYEKMVLQTGVTERDSTALL